MTRNFVYDTELGAVYLEEGSTFNVGNGQTKLFGNSAGSWGGEIRNDMKIFNLLHKLCGMVTEIMSMLCWSFMWESARRSTIIS